MLNSAGKIRFLESMGGFACGQSCDQVQQFIEALRSGGVGNEQFLQAQSFIEG